MNLNRYFGRDDIRFAKIISAVAMVTLIVLAILL